MTLFAISGYLIALMIVFAERLKRNRPAAMTQRSITISTPLGASLLVAIFVAQLWIVYYAATNHTPSARWELDLPWHVAHDNGPVMLHPDALGLAMAVLALLSTFVLSVIWRQIGDGDFVRQTRFALVAAAIIMGGCSMAAPALTSADIYSNVGYSLLGAASYSPPRVAFGESFALINHWWGTPMVPAPYGPLWIAGMQATLASVHTLFAKLIVLRSAALLAFCSFLFLLKRLFGNAIAAFAAVNPILWMQFVVNAHNDVFAVLLIAGAFAAVDSSVVLAGVLVVAAGLVKIPYALLGLLVYSRVKDRAVRYVSAVLSFVLALVLSVALGGHAYIAAISSHIQSRSNFFSGVHAVVAIIAVSVIVVTLVYGPKLRSASLLFPSLAAALFPWYLAWSIPYALLRVDYMGWFLVALPLAAAMSDSVFFRNWLGLAAVLISCVYAAAVAQRAMREKTASRG